MDDKERAIRQKLKDDFEHYAGRALKIRTKEGAIAPFFMNQAQHYIHNKLEEQKRNTGKVRAIILKGRQQGCSTYVEGRFYWQVTHRNGIRAFILTHDTEATNNLFEMAQRYHQYCHTLVKPEVDSSNAKELIFGRLDSGYKVGTAGNKAVGRSSTIQLFHGSEVAFWPNAQEHAKGVLQAVPDATNTEIILESTANGQNNYFYEQWEKAEKGLSDYIAIFVPWFWQGEYKKTTSDDFTPTEEESNYILAYKLSYEQAAWRRAKIEELGGIEEFRQEYPATAAEAFQVSGKNAFIDPALVLRARKTQAEAQGAKVLGVDPARFGQDRTSIAIRQGRVCREIISYVKKDTMEVAGIVAKLINTEHPDQVFIDVGGLGAGVYDRLKEMGYGKTITAINFGGEPLNKDKYMNKRTEMWGEMREWLKEYPIQIPDNDSLAADLTAPIYKQDDSLSRPVFYSKKELKEKGVRSPDEGDALALTFAFPVRQKTHHATNASLHHIQNNAWMGM